MCSAGEKVGDGCREKEIFSDFFSPRRVSSFPEKKRKTKQNNAQDTKWISQQFNCYILKLNKVISHSSLSLQKMFSKTEQGQNSFYESFQRRLSWPEPHVSCPRIAGMTVLMTRVGGIVLRSKVCPFFTQEKPVCATLLLLSSEWTVCSVSFNFIEPLCLRSK